MNSKKIEVFGKVQGVCFRYFTQQHALKLHVDGYAQNRMDGSVEILAYGQESDLAILIERINQGPPTSTVEGVVIEACNDRPLPGFRIL